jgi:hypothetical protein
MEEFLGRHAAEVEAGLARAREALAGGRAETVAFLLDEDPDDIRRVGG